MKRGEIKSIDFVLYKMYLLYVKHVKYMFSHSLKIQG